MLNSGWLLFFNRFKCYILPWSRRRTVLWLPVQVSSYWLIKKHGIIFPRHKCAPDLMRSWVSKPFYISIAEIMEASLFCAYQDRWQHSHVKLLPKWWEGLTYKIHRCFHVRKIFIFRFQTIFYVYINEEFVSKTR